MNIKLRAHLNINLVSQRMKYIIGVPQSRVSYHNSDIKRHSYCGQLTSFVICLIWQKVFMVYRTVITKKIAHLLSLTMS